MCNDLDQEICQLTQRSAEGVVDPLSAGVGRDLGRQTRQQPSERFGAVALQAKKSLSWPITPSMICACPRPIADRPSSTPGGSRRTVWPPPAPRRPPASAAPTHPRKPFVGQIRSVTVAATRASPMGLSSEEAVASPKAVMTPPGSTTRATLKP